VTLATRNIKPIGIGLVLGLVTLGFTSILPTAMAFDFFAVLLAIIAAIYVGFAIADGRDGIKWIEISTAVIFIIVALLGLWISPWILIAGYLAHGLWDWLHHAQHIQTDVQNWYPPFCAVYDVVVGLGLLFWI
jgi:Family of unknown function (DUF6010)